MEVTHAALCSSGSGKFYCDCGAEVRALREEVERLRAESHARLDAIEYLLNTGIFAGNDAEDAQQHAMSIIDAARKGEGE